MTVGQTDYEQAVVVVAEVLSRAAKGRKVEVLSARRTGDRGRLAAPWMLTLECGHEQRRRQVETRVQCERCPQVHTAYPKVARAFTVEGIFGPRRYAPLVEVRLVAWAVLIRLQWSVQRIADAFARTHATVCEGLQKIEHRPELLALAASINGGGLAVEK